MNNDVSKRRSYYQPKLVELLGASLLNKRASSCTELFRTPDRLSRASVNRNKSQIFNHGHRSSKKTLECSSLAKEPNENVQRKVCANEGPAGTPPKTSPLSERGVPEGQEDPDLFSSQSLLIEQKLIHASTPKRSSRLSSMFNLYQSVPNLQLLFKSIKQPPKTLSPEEKRVISEWARKKIENQLDLPFPEWSETKFLRSEVSLFNEKSTDKTANFAVPSFELHLVDDKVIKTFACFQKFYLGKPQLCSLFITTKCLLVIDSFSTILWKADLSLLQLAEVRWNYSVLLLRSVLNDIKSEICLNFLDPSELRFAASCLSIELTKGGKDSSVVTTESPFNCRLFWKSVLSNWEIEQHSKKVFEDFDLRYLGLVFFEESPYVLNDPSALITTRSASYLMYKWSDSSSWRAGYFKISSGMLCQYNHYTDTVPSLSMSLGEDECKGYGRNFHSRRPHTLEIQFHGGKSLSLAGASEAEANDWLILLSQALSTESHNHTKRPTPCGLLVSENYAFLFHVAQTFTVLSCTPLEAISVIRTTEHDTSCLVEFDYREAHEGGGDWILYFQSETSFDEFLHAVPCPQEELPATSSAILRNKNLTLKLGS